MWGCHGTSGTPGVEGPVTPAINFNFISNNVKGLKPTKKLIKLIEYFKSKLAPSGVLFAQETHSTKGNRTKMER